MKIGYVIPIGMDIGMDIGIDIVDSFPFPVDAQL